jgi:hypothetical protein
MTLYTFRLLSPQVQLHLVLTRGTYIAQRWEDEGGVNLYHLPDDGRGFFAEVGVNEEHECLVVLRSFSSSVPLEDYAHGVRLPEGL